jgi:hypothetical protein
VDLPERRRHTNRSTKNLDRSSARGTRKHRRATAQKPPAFHESKLDPVGQIRSEILSACRLLLAAFTYSRSSDVDPWQFAVELVELHQRGLANVDIRWMIANQFAEHRREITVPGDAIRSFRPLSPTDFPQATAIMLSKEGAQQLAAALPTDASKFRGVTENAVQAPKIKSSNRVRALPIWDQLRRELKYKNRLVKRFRVPAANQELILQAFQEECWPRCIDDPLPPVTSQDAKERLQATIKGLNRHQLASVLRFHGNGNGQQIFWDAVEARTKRSHPPR